MTNNTERKAFAEALERKFLVMGDPEWHYGHGYVFSVAHKHRNGCYADGQILWELWQEATQAALSQRENTDKPLEQDGEWVLAPREPTREQLDAAIREQQYMLRVSLNPSQGDYPAKHIYQAMLSAAPAPSLYDIPDNELPGMWEKADFEGGKPDVVRGPAPSLCTAEEAAELARYYVHRAWRYPKSASITYEQLAAIINADRAKR